MTDDSLKMTEVIEQLTDIDEKNANFLIPCFCSLMSCFLTPAFWPLFSDF